MKRNHYSITFATLGFLFSGLISPPISWADSLDVWTAQTKGLPEDDSELLSVAYGNGRFVAVGWSHFATSTDGTNWFCGQSLNSGTNEFGYATNTVLKSVAFGNGEFVAAGYETTVDDVLTLVVETSMDGTNWVLKELPMSGENHPAIAFGNGTFALWASGVATSPSGTSSNCVLAFSSPGGANWSSSSCSLIDPGAITCFGMTYGNGAFICLTEGYNNDPSSSFVWSSSDTQNWWPHFVPSPQMECLAYGDGTMVVCGLFGDEAIFTSTNDLSAWTLDNPQPTWTQAAPSSDTYVHNGFVPWAVASGNGTFVAGGYELLISAPTTNTSTPWVRRADLGDSTIYGLTYGNGMWVAVGASAYSGEGIDKVPPLIMTSGNLFRAPPPHFVGLHNNLSSVALAAANSVHQNLYVTVGALGSILSSSNGTDWAVMNSPTTYNLGAVTSTPDGSYIAVGDYGTILTSIDGTNWVPETPIVTNDLYGVATSEPTPGVIGQIDVAVGAGGVFLLSTNDTQWTELSFSWGTDLKSVTFGNGQFEALASDGTILVSSDGIDWKTSVVGSGLVTISYGGGQFAGLNANGDVLTSSDALHWSSYLSGLSSGLSGQLRGVSLLNNQLVLVGDNGAVVGAQFEVNGTGTENELQAIAQGNGTYVAVGYEGTIIKSLDAVAWTAPTNYVPTDNWLYGVAYGNGMFAGVGENAWIVTSQDGDNWTSTNTHATLATLTAIAYGSGRFVAIGRRGIIITSTDGNHWTVADSGTIDDLDAITWANGQFVITGDADEQSLTSTNGITWTLGGNGLDATTLGVTGGNGLFVAVDYYGGIFTSSDGLNWAQQAATGLSLRSGAYANGIYVVAGDNGTLFASPNGTNWTQIQSLTDQSLNGIVGSDGQFVAVGHGGTSLTAGAATLASVPSALGWSAIASPSTMNYYSVICNGQFYLATGDSADFSVLSSNGMNWTLTGGAIDDTFNGLSWGSGRFVAIGDYNKTYTSVDGKNWTEQADLPVTVYAVTFGGGAFVAAGEAGEVFKSTDGIHWTPHNTGLIDDLEGITYGNGKFVVVAWDGTIASSPDGGAWTLSANQATTSTLYGATYANNLYVAVGESGTIVTSPDAMTWTLQTNWAVTPNTLRSITWGQNQFVAVGYQGWTVRGDGTNWTSSSSATVRDLYSVTFANGRFVAVGEHGAIIETPLAVPSQLSAAQMADGGLQITVQGTKGSTYAIEVSTNLINWSQLSSITLSSATGQFVDPLQDVRAWPSRFYRAVLLP